VCGATIQKRLARGCAPVIRRNVAEGRSLGCTCQSCENCGGYVKPANERKHRKDRRLAHNQSGKRQVVIVARQRDGATLTHVAATEAEGVAFAAANVKRGATVHADEASHWDRLAAYFPIKRINHKEAYSKDGACTNMAESYFSRLRRAEVGIHHHIAGRYLAAYVTENRLARGSEPGRQRHSVHDGYGCRHRRIAQ